MGEMFSRIQFIIVRVLKFCGREFTGQGGNGSASLRQSEEQRRGITRFDHQADLF